MTVEDLLRLTKANGQESAGFRSYHMTTTPRAVQQTSTATRAARSGRQGPPSTLDQRLRPSRTELALVRIGGLTSPGGYDDLFS